MLQNNEKERPNLKYIQMDALNTSFDNNQFNVVLDKGTLDAILSDNSPEIIDKARKYFAEIQRILKVGGRYICVTLLQEHILNELLNYFIHNNFMFRAVRCFEAENADNSLPVFIVVCTKFHSLPRMILELNLDRSDKMVRYETLEQIKEQIFSTQQAAFIFTSLKKSSIVDDNEVSMDLFESGNEKPKYTIYIVDIPPEKNNEQYAAFIVPQGREAEWLFSTKSGRKHLVKMTKHNRLVIVTLHRGFKYDSLELVQNELEETVCNLAPTNFLKKKIKFLSIGADVGKREVRFEGKSELSGDYVIEDTETDDKQRYRRLFYLNNQLVIQSEAKLKTIKTRKGVQKEIVDLNHLVCKHHIYMSIAANVASKQNTKNASLVVIGLGGGGLCSFLHKFLPNINILGIDNDEDMLKIATNWFYFQQNDKLQAKIQDGLDFLKESTPESFSAVLFDVDSKDTQIGMSCPPKHFLEPTVLDNIRKVLTKNGLFVLNIVLRDSSLRPTVIKNLKNKFQTLVCYKLEEDLNEIIICSNSLNKEQVLVLLKEASLDINRYFKKNNVNTIDCNEFLQSLNVL